MLLFGGVPPFHSPINRQFGLEWRWPLRDLKSTESGLPPLWTSEVSPPLLIRTLWLALYTQFGHPWDQQKRADVRVRWWWWLIKHNSWYRQWLHNQGNGYYFDDGGAYYSGPLTWLVFEWGWSTGSIRLVTPLLPSSTFRSGNYGQWTWALQGEHPLLMCTDKIGHPLYKGRPLFV